MVPTRFPASLFGFPSVSLLFLKCVSLRSFSGFWLKNQIWIPAKKTHSRDFTLTGINYRVHRFSNFCSKSQNFRQNQKASVTNSTRPQVDPDSGTENLLSLTLVVANPCSWSPTQLTSFKAVLGDMTLWADSVCVQRRKKNKSQCWFVGESMTVRVEDGRKTKLTPCWNSPVSPSFHHDFSQWGNNLQLLVAGSVTCRRVLAGPPQRVSISIATKSSFFRSNCQGMFGCLNTVLGKLDLLTAAVCLRPPSWYSETATGVVCHCTCKCSFKTGTNTCSVYIS